jgi:SAM-dependent methyltransferase
MIRMAVDDEVLAHYSSGKEQGRLLGGPSLELIRTRVLLERFLPPPPATVLDVGGGAGVHAGWLAGRGYHVRLVDPVPVHVEQARSLPGVHAELGDARDLPALADSVDTVLLLGPLYHLTDRADRIRALTEARRVLAPGGTIAVAVISRYAPMFDGYWYGYVDDPDFVHIMMTDLGSGQHRNPRRVPQWFTTAHFHGSDELEQEMAEAGFADRRVLPVEGPLHWAPGIEARLADPDSLATLLEVLEALEGDPGVRAATAHLLGVATKQ